MKTEQHIFSLALQEGLYLAATMPHTEKYIREQTAKYQDIALSPLPISLQKKLQTFRVGLGKHQLQYIQLLQLLQRFYTKYDDELKALTEYLFVLRAILYNDAFKSFPKAVERKNPRWHSSSEAVAFAKENALFEDDQWHPYTELQAALLYHFVYLLYNGKSCLAHRQNGHEFEAVTAAKHILDEEQALQQTFQAMTHFDAYALAQEEAVALRTLCDVQALDAVSVQLVRQQGMHIEQLLATTYVSNDEAARLQEQVHEPYFSQLIVQTALAKLARQTTEALQTTALKQPTTQVKEIKVPSKQKIVKPVVQKESSKELQQLKAAMEAATQRYTALEEALQLEQKKTKDAQLALTNVTAQLEDMTFERDLLIAEKEPHANALSLIENMQTMMMQLQRELQTTEEEAEEQSLLDALKSLKIAVVGGHQNFHQEMKKRLPSVSLVIGPEDLHFDEKKLVNYDVIILAIKYCNHSLYERVFDYLKRQQLKDKCIVTSLKNVDMIAQEIYYRFIA